MGQAQRHTWPDALLGRFAGVGIDGLGFPGLAADNQAGLALEAGPGWGNGGGVSIGPTFDGRSEKGDIQANDQGSPLRARLMDIRWPAGPSLFFRTRTWAW